MKNRKEIDIEELIKYVKDRVTSYALENNLKQTPVAYTNIQGQLFLPTFKSSEEEEIIIDVPDLKDGISKVRKLLKEKDYDGAEKLLKKLLEEDNLNYEVNILLEDLEIKREKDRIEKEKKKRELFEEWKKRGESFLQSGDYAKAKECFENARKMYPEDAFIKALLEGMEQKRQIIKIDDIEVPGGDKIVVLNKLFSDAEKLKSKKEYTKALNHYNQILKIYPGNKRAIKEKILLYEKWLDDYKREMRYFEMLGLLEDVILEDETIIGIEEFSNVYDETLLSYAEAFIKTRFNQELSAKMRKLEKKEELIRRYENVLSDYEELSMEREYNELKKVLGRLKGEAKPLNAEVQKYHELLNREFFSKSNIDSTVEILRNIIEESLSDEYLKKAFRPITNKQQEDLFKEVKMLPEETYEQIIFKIEKFKSLILKVSESIKEIIIKYELKELEIKKKRKFEELKKRKALERNITKENEKESFKKDLLGTIFNISIILFFMECFILHRKIFTGEKILFDVWDITAYNTYFLAILTSIFCVKHIADSRITDSIEMDSRINKVLLIFLIPILFVSLYGLGFIIAFIILIIKLFSKEYIRFLLEKFIPSFLIYCIPIFPFVTIITSYLIVKLTGKRYNAWFAFIPHILWILFFLRKFHFL